MEQSRSQLRDEARSEEEREVLCERCKRPLGEKALGGEAVNEKKPRERGKTTLIMLRGARSAGQMGRAKKKVKARGVGDVLFSASSSAPSESKPLEKVTGSREDVSVLAGVPQAATAAGSKPTRTIEEIVTGKKLKKSSIPASEMTIDQSHREFVGSKTPEEFEKFIQRIRQIRFDMDV